MTLAVPNPRTGLNEHWLTFDEFLRLADEGAFGSSEHLELIDGRVIDLAPIGQAHGAGTFDAAYTIRRVLERTGLDARLRVYSPVTLRISRTRAPQPDILVAHRSAQSWVTPDITELVVEYTVTTHEYDLGQKPGIYAAAGVAEYWVIDRPARRLHVFRAPEGGTYTDIGGPLSEEDTIFPLFAPDLAIPVADLL